MDSKEPRMNAPMQKGGEPPTRSTILGALPKRRSGSLGLHDRFPGLALAHRTLATLAFGGALFGRCHPAASAFLHSEVSFDLREYSIGARATVQMKTLKTMVTGKH
jgi:hypothetical protein